MNTTRVRIYDNANLYKCELRENWLMYFYQGGRVLMKVVLILSLVAVAIFVCLPIIRDSTEVWKSIVARLIVFSIFISIAIFCVIAVVVTAKLISYKLRIRKMNRESNFVNSEYVLEFNNDCLIEHLEFYVNGHIKYSWDDFDKYYIQPSSIKLMHKHTVFRTFHRECFTEEAYNELAQIVKSNVKKGIDRRT